MSAKNGIRMIAGVLPIVLACWTSSLVQAEEGAKPKALLSPEEELAWAQNVIGPDETGKNENNCKECHTLEYDAWTQTQHYATFKERHRSDRAKEILSNLGERSMKRSSECRQCHYTPIAPPSAATPSVAARPGGSKRQRLDVKWGVSCESCHSPARNWHDVHNRAGGDLQGDVLKWGEGKQAAAGSREKRIAAAEQLGMIHPGKLYLLASNCMGCHTVPREELVNKGDHKAGSEFELATWSQGEIRHSFLSSPGAPDDSTNRPATAEHRRMLFVVGTLVDLEYTARNLSGIDEVGGKYHLAMVERGGELLTRVRAIQAASSTPEVASLISAAPKQLTTESKVGPDWVAKIRSAAQSVAAKYDGSTFGPLDEMISSDVKGKPFEDAR